MGRKAEPGARRKGTKAKRKTRAALGRVQLEWTRRLQLLAVCMAAPTFHHGSSTARNAVLCYLDVDAINAATRLCRRMLLITYIIWEDCTTQSPYLEARNRNHSFSLPIAFEKHQFLAFSPLEHTRHHYSGEYCAITIIHARNNKN